MSDYFPFLIAILIVLLTFISAMKNGVVKLLSSGAAALALAIVLIAGVHFLPVLADQFLDLELSWKMNLGISCVLAIFTYTVSRFFFGWVFRVLLGPDSWMHGLADGVPGGILSLFPSLVIVFVLFNFVRIAGTQLELNYVASLSRDGIVNTVKELPPYPTAARWRNQVEDAPMVAGALDLIDPFSNRVNRNMAALVMVSQSNSLKGFLLDQGETADLVGLSGFGELAAEPLVSEALKTNQPVEIVSCHRIQDEAKEFSEAEKLRLLDLEPVLTRFVDQIVPVVVPEVKPSDIP
ncbi:MAG: hypothetical protein P1U68_16345 [Verrucomicrobiales bacterium]|nr:hypothetical protein [Verrucomicrobiales bacterium]